jgi:rubrerythrin
MTDTEGKLIDLMEQQIEVEKRNLSALAEAENEAKETAVRLALMNMRLDTWKHQKFLEGMIEMLTTTPCDEWSAKVGRYAGRVKLERDLEAIMNDENDMIKLASDALELVKDPLAAFLLEKLREEEERRYGEIEELVTLIQRSPLQSKKGQKGTDVICDTDL